MTNGSDTQLKEAPLSASGAVQVPGTKSTLGENLLLCHDRASGLSAAIAVDDTTLGPGLGGVRWKSYDSFDVAVDEACRLARVMTLKNALADIPYGGAKSVILRQGESGWTQPDRTAQLLAFAGFVNRLGGAYIPGVDMGTSVADLATIASASPWASCDHVDPSPATAEGVYFAIAAAIRQRLHRDLNGIKVVVQGVGHVGAALAERLNDAGATVVISDVDAVRAATVAHRFGGTTIDPGVAHAQPCDVFAPCGPARVLNARSIDAMRCALVVGAANDVLSERADAALLAQRGITYVPDFVTNAGGVIQIHSERAKWDGEELAQALMRIGQITIELLQSADDDHHVLPLTVAEALASDRLGHLVTIPD
ncbi:MAG TPA: Glu/Leu/Phe/Val dehydrogenase dimerization domain-containing protein [Acidimicrobiales bacterium]